VKLLKFCERIQSCKTIGDNLYNLNFAKIFLERSSAHHAAFYATQYALPGHGIHQRFFEYQKYLQLPDGFGHRGDLETVFIRRFTQSF
jgi:hypothetical protein